MARAIRISAGAVTADAELNDSQTAAAIWAALPLEFKAETWGDEIYASIGLALGAEDPRETVALGELAYWPPGQAFCIFFGPTPMSRGDEIRPASAVTVVGRVLGDPTVFRQVRAGTRVRLERGER
jgi:uncharacterized protein